MTGWIDTYLRFADEPDAILCLPQYRAIGDDGPAWVRASHDHALDPIGPLPDVGGWHVNLRTRSAPDVPAEYVVQPQSPRRVWAGSV